MSANSEPQWTIAQANAAENAFRAFNLPAERRYQYSQLKAREIRLLKISLTATRDSILGLELKSTSLESAPPFQAISYCWGESQEIHKVPIINGTDRRDADTHDAHTHDAHTHDTHTRQDELSWIGVTKSLAQMLAYLPRHCIPGETSSYVWIDQLCINQNEGNSAEKTHQIKLMGEIYSRATQVLIWFGPGPDPAAAGRMANINILGSSPISTEDKTAMRYIWENEWFERTWVVQESCLAQDRQLLVGLHAMSWDFAMKQVMLQIFASDLPSLSMDVDISAVSRHVAVMKAWQKFEDMSDHCDASRGLLLCSFLARFGQYLKASRNKGLAFMSLWSPPSFDIAATSGKRPDQVHTRFARSLVKDTKRLDLLAALRSPIRENTAGDTFQPSWVPRWDEKETSPPSPLMAACYCFTTLSPLSILRHRRHSRQGTASLQTPSTVQWKASSPHNEHEYVSQEDLEDPTLTTRGRIICHIQDVFPIIPHHTHIISAQGIERFKSSLRSRKTSITIQEAMKTIIECTELGRPDEASGRGTLCDFRQLISNIGPDEVVPQETIDDLEFYGPSINLFDSTGRRFFTTTWPEKAQIRHGLGPGWTETGDDIAILHGARFPVILRKFGGRSQTYQVVGDCYIPGIMEGEAVHWAEEEADNIVLV